MILYNSKTIRIYVKKWMLNFKFSMKHRDLKKKLKICNVNVNVNGCEDVKLKKKI